MAIRVTHKRTFNTVEKESRRAIYAKIAFINIPIDNVIECYY